MIPSPLRRAVPLAAFIASLPLSAAGNPDAAFASALNQGAPSFARLAQAKAKPQKPAAAAPKAPRADAAVWGKVIETVKRDGKYKAGNGFMPGSFSIEDSTGDPKGARTMRGISVLGMINDEEQFEAMGAMIVVMEYTLDPKDGNWRINQWMFQTDIYGEVGDVRHAVVIQTPDGKTVSVTPEKLNPADPKIQAQYDAMLKHWAERKP